MAFQDDIDEPPQKIWYAQDKYFRSYIHPELLKLAFKFVEILSYVVYQNIWQGDQENMDIEPVNGLFDPSLITVTVIYV